MCPLLFCERGLPSGLRLWTVSVEDDPNTYPLQGAEHLLKGVVKCIQQSFGTTTSVIIQCDVMFVVYRIKNW